MFLHYVVKCTLCIFSFTGLIPLSGNAQVFNTAGISARIKSVKLYHSKALKLFATLAIKDSTLILLSTQPRDTSVKIAKDFLFCMPLKNLQLTSSFGWRRHPVTGKADFHKGVDLSARSEPIYSVLKGIVNETGFNPILGNFIRIEHGAVQSIYGHLSLIIVRAGQTVDAAQVIGMSGSTGRATGEHLHFSIKTDGTYIHPLHFLKRLAD